MVVNGATSSSTIVTSGVPQGAVLGPFLFLLYINDLPDNLSTSVRLFADDCILYTPIRTQNDSSLLQNDLLKLQKWQATLLTYLLTCLVCLRRRTRSTTNDRSPCWSVLRCCHGITQGQLGVVDDLVSQAEWLMKFNPDKCYTGHLRLTCIPSVDKH